MTFHKEVKEDSYVYRKLKEQFPLSTKFYSWYDDGDYYNTQKTYYYNDRNELIYTEDHKVYG